MLINPGASVKLSAVDVGSKRRFGIRAAREIKKNDIIHELIGLMPMDNETPHTRISEITPSSGQNQPTDALRILFGPMRFVNHLCSNSNASVSHPLCHAFTLILIQLLLLVCCGKQHICLLCLRASRYRFRRRGYR